MRRILGFRAGFLSLALVMCGAAESASPGRTILASIPMAVLEETRGPIGWQDFCRNGHSDDCRVGRLPARNVVLNDATWAEIVKVNRVVNATIEQVEDITLYGVQERWTYPDNGKGDCEDLALLKRRMLIKAGIPRQAVLMTVVRDETGAGHAVLTVVTDRGDYVLDSKTSKVLPWGDTGYGYIKRQSQEDPNVWVRLGEPGSPGMTVAGH
jgi:predicted transglutaminase-like cysteine proteinase